MKFFPLLRTATAIFLVAILCSIYSTLAIAWKNWPAYFLPLVLHNSIPKPTPAYPIVISEVAYNPGLEEPGAEWVELYPSGAGPLDLNQLRIGDEETPQGNEGFYRFPQGKVSSPGKSIVIANRAVLFQATYGFLPDYEFNDSLAEVPNMEKDPSWSNGSINLSNSGDEILATDSKGAIIDAVSWGTSTFAFNPSVKTVKDGHTLERVPANHDSDQAADWVEQPVPNPGSVHLFSLTPTPTWTSTPSRTPTLTATLTPSLTPKPCPPVGLLVSEVLYDPADSLDPVGEWIELFNPGEEDADLDCYRIGDEETPGGGEGMLVFPACRENILAGQEVAVIAYRSDTFLGSFGFLPDYEIFDSSADVPNMAKHSSWASGNLNLSNAGDEVLLLDSQDHLVDALSWGDSSFAFSPAIPTIQEGHSLERLPANRDRDSAEDWSDSSAPDPGKVKLTFPSQTPTTTRTAMLTRTPTPTRTITATRTVTPINSPTPTRTATWTRTPTFTRTATPTRTPTLTQTPATGLVINEIHAEPAPGVGDANHDGEVSLVEDEFLEFVNSTGAPLDLSGWAIRDGVSIRHQFPAGTQLPFGCSVLVFGGGLPQGDFGHSVVQVASTGDLSLNDRGDTLVLIDNEGNSWAYYAYGEEANDEQSITRDPDIFGADPLVKHTLAEGSLGAIFSPGTRINGLAFTGCP